MAGWPVASNWMVLPMPALEAAKSSRGVASGEGIGGAGQDVVGMTRAS